MDEQGTDTTSRLRPVGWGPFRLRREDRWERQARQEVSEMMADVAAVDARAGGPDGG